LLTRASVALVLLVPFASPAAAAVEHAALPAVWRFRLDPGDAGRKQQWFAADHDDAAWSALSTHDGQGWRKQAVEGEGW